MTYTMLPELKTSQRGHLKSNKFPYMRNVVYIGQEKHRGMYNTAELLLLGNTITDEKLEVQKQKFNCYDVVNFPLFRYRTRHHGNHHQWRMCRNA